MSLTRREMLACTGVTLLTLMEAEPMTTAAAAESRPNKGPFHHCLNTSTLRGHKLPLVDVVEIAAKAGYEAIEPWIEEIQRHVQSGGSLKDLNKRIRDLGLTVEGGIGFAEWIVDDDARRAKGLEVAKRDMDLLLQIGGKRMAAPAMGATDRNDMHPLKIAERYRALLEIGDQIGVVPMVEVWGFSQTLRSLGEAAYVAIEARHPKACVLADIYHLYKGGSDYAGLRLLHGQGMPVLHVNDYPAIPREKINDSDRVYPGDGIAPLDTIFQELKALGFQGYLSLELFNETYWKQDALTVAKTGLEKTRAAVEKALA